MFSRGGTIAAAALVLIELALVTSPARSPARATRAAAAAAAAAAAVGEAGAAL